MAEEDLLTTQILYEDGNEQNTETALDQIMGQNTGLTPSTETEPWLCLWFK